MCLKLKELDCVDNISDLAVLGGKRAHSEWAKPEFAHFFESRKELNHGKLQ